MPIGFPNEQGEFSFVYLYYWDFRDSVARAFSPTLGLVVERESTHQAVSELVVLMQDWVKDAVKDGLEFFRPLPSEGLEENLQRVAEISTRIMVGWGVLKFNAD